MLRTSPPGHPVILFDGHCTFCQGAASTLARMAGKQVELRSFREPGVLAPFAGISADRCEKAMQWVSPDGQVFEGAEAVVQALRGRFWGKLAMVYYLPGIRQLADAVYRLIARHRFKIAGRRCEDGTCSLHR